MSFNFYYSGTSGPSATVTAANLAARGYDTVGKNGVVKNSQGQGANALVVATTNAGNLSVTITAGDWWTNGYLGQSTAATTLQFAANSSGSARLDAVCAQIDLVGNAASLVVVQGPNGGGAPSISTTGTTLQVLLAFVTIANGWTTANTIPAANVSDERGNYGYNSGYAAPLAHAHNHGPSGSLATNAADPLPTLAWPEGFGFGPTVALGHSLNLQDFGWNLLSPGATYTVPTNFTLYMTGFISTGNGGSLQVQNTQGTASLQTVFSSAYTNQIVVDLPQPLIVGAGGTVKNPSGTVNSYFKGVLIPATGKIGTITVTLVVNQGQSFTVPAGDWFVLTHLYTAQAATAQATLDVNGWAFAPPGSTPTLSYFSASGTPVFGSSVVDANGAFALAIRSPMLFSPGMYFGNLSVSGNPIILSGYTFPQTG